MQMLAFIRLIKIQTKKKLLNKCLAYICPLHIVSFDLIVNYINILLYVNVCKMHNNIGCFQGLIVLSCFEWQYFFL